ncbi:uncharacterized protein SCHCODRAFT_02556979 [Schizophyllum commune H4-8]|nr:uncharacterized protein SCHCODRAFT_02556979 [Schizophyllum commune H4-8]KAI5885516.1 hypothetical protein SCHCODRAFT_02556979 [Schizophyllum commune H4-8]
MEVEQSGYEAALDTLPSSILSAIADLDLSKICALEEKTRFVMAALKSARNAHALIDKLPAEVLERIFLLVQRHYGDFLPKWPVLKSLEWIAITHVCRRWRLIATAHPALWTTLDLCHNWSADAGRTFLARSGDAPLTVFFSTRDLGYSNNDMKVLKDALDTHSDRLAVLHVAADRRRDFNEVCELFVGIPAPRLRSLTLYIRQPRRNHVYTGPRIFEGTLPLLRKLVVAYCAAWDMLNIIDLTHLAICKVGVDELLKIVGASPHLEELICIGSDEWSRSAANDDPSSPSVICLPQLRYLQLSTPEGIKRIPFLHRLEIPEACNVRLQLLLEDPITTLLPSNSHFGPLQRPVPTVQLCTGRFLSCWIAFRSGHIVVEGRCNYSHFAGITNTNTVLEVQLDDLTDRTSPEGWSRLLASMPKIRTLVIYGRGEARGLRGLFAVLSSRPEGAESLLCPDLEALHLGADHADAGVAFSLWQVSALRAKEGRPLREVIVFSDGEKGHLGRGQSSDGTRHALILDASGAPTQVDSRAWKCNTVKFAEIVARQARPLRRETGLDWAWVERKRIVQEQET